MHNTIDGKEHRLARRGESFEISNDGTRRQKETITHGTAEQLHALVSDVDEKTLQQAEKELRPATTPQARTKVITAILQRTPEAILDDLGEKLNESALLFTRDLLPMITGNDANLARRAVLMARGTHWQQMLTLQVNEVNGDNSARMEEWRNFYRTLLPLVGRTAGDEGTMGIQNAVITSLITTGNFHGFLVDNEKFSTEFFTELATVEQSVRKTAAQGTPDVQKHRGAMLKSMGEFRQSVQKTRKELRDEGVIPR